MIVYENISQGTLQSDLFNRKKIQFYLQVNKVIKSSLLLPIVSQLGCATLSAPQIAPVLKM